MKVYKIIEHLIVHAVHRISCIGKFERVMLALGNVADDSPLLRDMVLAHGTLSALLQLLNGHTKPSILRKATQILGDLCRSLPAAKFEHVWSCSDGKVALYAVLCLIRLVVL